MAQYTISNISYGDNVYTLKDSAALPKAGGTMSGAIAMGSNKITGLADATADGDAVNKSQLDGHMKVLSYGKSTWNDFLAAYNTNSVIYCRASTANNPASGQQTIMACLTYVDKETNPTSAEFHYYKSDSGHTDALQGDQVFIYHLTSSNGGTWSCTTHNSFTKIVAGTGLSSSYSSGELTLNNDTIYESKTAASGGTDVSLVTTGEKYTWNAMLPKAGGTMSGAIAMGSNKITGLANGTANGDAVNKSQLDGKYTKPSGGIPDSDIASASTWNAKGTYSKPNGGIPKTDLASAVQTSLGKADSAYQKPAGGIPESDLSQAVQSILDDEPAPNLLDNWYFVGGGSQQGDEQFPINQRGLTSYSSSAEFGIDRWKSGGVSVTVSSDYITLANQQSERKNLMQSFEGSFSRFAGKTITISMLDGNGNLYTNSDTVAATAPTTHTTYASVSHGSGVFSFNYSSAAGKYYIGISVDSGKSINVVAVKFELGNAQTLAHQVNNAWVLRELPDYVEHMNRCRRYFFRLKNEFSGGVLNIANGFFSSTTMFVFCGSVPVPIRRGANGSLSGTLYVGDSGHSGSSSLAVSTVGEFKLNPSGILSGNVTVSNATTKGNAGILAFRDTTSYLDFSAEV